LLSIRPATVDDIALIMTMIRELAEFEKGLPSVSNDEASLARDGFGPEPKFRASMLLWDGIVAGYTIYFDFYSTWRGRLLYLEDLYVRPEFRGKGIGKSALAFVAKLACDENYAGVRWEVLDWNTPAVELYKSLGARFLDDWKTVLLDGEALQTVARR
jgi:GNAT superfamily N-acetyltransferase